MPLSALRTTLPVVWATVVVAAAATVLNAPAYSGAPASAGALCAMARATKHVRLGRGHGHCARCGRRRRRLVARVQQLLVIVPIARLQQHARMVFYGRACGADQGIVSQRSAARARSGRKPIAG